MEANIGYLKTCQSNVIFFVFCFGLKLAAAVYYNP